MSLSYAYADAVGRVDRRRSPSASLAAIAAQRRAAAGLVAPRSECKAQKNTKAPERQQEDAMRCLLNYARYARPAPGSLGASRSLERAAGRSPAT